MIIVESEEGEKATDWKAGKQESMYCTRCGVYCTKFADCIVQVVQCVLYKVCSVHFTSKSSVNKENFDV